MRPLLLATLLGLTAVSAVMFSLPLSSRADSGVNLSFSADYDGQVITPGQTLPLRRL